MSEIVPIIANVLLTLVTAFRLAVLVISILWYNASCEQPLQLCNIVLSSGSILVLIIKVVMCYLKQHCQKMFIWTRYLYYATGICTIGLVIWHLKMFFDTHESLCTNVVYKISQVTVVINCVLFFCVIVLVLGYISKTPTEPRQYFVVVLKV